MVIAESKEREKKKNDGKSFILSEKAKKEKKISLTSHKLCVFAIC